MGYLRLNHIIVVDSLHTVIYKAHRNIFNLNVINYPRTCDTELLGQRKKAGGPDINSDQSFNDSGSPVVSTYSCVCFLLARHEAGSPSTIQNKITVSEFWPGAGPAKTSILHL